MVLLNKFLGWCSTVGKKEAAKSLDTYPSVVERWLKGTHQPPADKLSTFFDLFMSNEYAEGQPIHLKRPEWSGKLLTVAVPCYKQTNAASAWVWVALALDLGKDNVRMDMECGDAVIANARNKLAVRFLQSESEWMLMLDDDIIPPIGRAKWFRFMTGCPDQYPEELAGEHVVHRLLSHKKTLVGGLYHARQKSGPPIFHEALTIREMNLKARDVNQRGLLPTRWVGTGCLLIHRSVLEDIMKKFPERKYVDPSYARNCGEFNFFRMENGKGEDFSFCETAAEAGHTPHVDLGLRCAHVGYCAWSNWNTVDNLSKQGT